MIVRNHEGEIVEGFAGPTYALCPLVAELCAIIEGLKLIPFLPIIFTSDSQALKYGKVLEDWRTENVLCEARFLFTNRQISWH